MDIFPNLSYQLKYEKKSKKESRPRQDSNLQSLDSKSSALSIRPRGRDSAHVCCVRGLAE